VRLYFFVFLKKNEIMYSARMKMADIITDSKILSVLERLNIKLGFGEATIEEICNKYHLSTHLFLMICNIYSFDDFTPNIDGLTENDIPKIIGYLKKSHEYWLNSCFPQLHKNIHTMLDSCDEVNKNVLNKFYDDYDVEVKKHLDYEEHTVFPYILSLGKEKGSFRIKDFEENHSDLDEKLSDLKNIVMKYLPEAYVSQARIDVLNDIFKIEEDLNKHTVIENSLLIPLVSKIEQ